MRARRRRLRCRGQRGRAPSSRPATWSPAPTPSSVTFADGTESTAQVDRRGARATTSPCSPPTGPRGHRARRARRRRLQIGDEAFAVGHPLGLVDSLSAGRRSRGSTAPIPVGDGSTLDGLDPVRRGGEPGQLGRAAPQPQRPGDRHRHGARQPVRAGLLHRHRLRRPHRQRPAAPQEDRSCEPRTGRTSPLRPPARAHADGARRLPGEEGHRRPGRPARAADRGPARPRPRPRRGRARPGQDDGHQDAGRSRSAASSSASSSRPTSCPPTSSAPGSTTSSSASSRPRSARSTPTSCWPTRSTGRRPRCRARCSR